MGEECRDLYFSKLLNCYPTPAKYLWMSVHLLEILSVLKIEQNSSDQNDQARLHKNTAFLEKT